MTLTILGLGTARPPGSISQADAAKMAEGRCCRSDQDQRLLAAVFRQTRVRRRASTLLVPTDDRSSNPSDNGGTSREAWNQFYPQANGGRMRGPGVARRMRRYVEAAVPTALDASRSALQEAGVEPAEISDLIVISCTGFSSPGLDIKLIEALELRRTVSRTMIGFMGCHGAINGLRVAHGLASNRRDGHVLMCAVEMCSLHFQYGPDQHKLLANALFADGAAAVVGAYGPTQKGQELIKGRSPRRRQPWRLVSTGSCILPDSKEDMTWTIGNYGFEMTLSKRVPSLIEKHLEAWLAGWLAEHGLGTTDIGSWAIHPGGPRIVEAVERCLNLSSDSTCASRQILAECGNMSSPTVLFIVDRLRRLGAGTPCVAIAFGPGLVVEAALLDV